MFALMKFNTARSLSLHLAIYSSILLTILFSTKNTVQDLSIWKNYVALQGKLFN